jgi:hypothetical protein
VLNVPRISLDAAPTATRSTWRSAAIGCRRASEAARAAVAAATAATSVLAASRRWWRRLSSSGRCRAGTGAIISVSWQLPQQVAGRGLRAKLRHQLLDLIVGSTGGMIQNLDQVALSASVSAAVAPDIEARGSMMWTRGQRTGVVSV